MDATEPSTGPILPSRGKLTLVFLMVVAVGLVIGAILGNDDATVTVDEGSGPLVGSPAPEVVIELFDGSTWRLSEHLAEDGRPLVLNLWASWCIPCRQEIPELSAFARENPGIAVVGVAVEDQETEARAMAADLQPAYPVGMDATGRLRERYPSFGMPFTVVIDASGIVRHELVGGVTADQLSRFFD